MRRVWGKHFGNELMQSDSTALKSINCINSQAITSQEESVQTLDVYYKYLLAIFVPGYYYQANNCDIKELPARDLFRVQLCACLVNPL